MGNGRGASALAWVLIGVGSFLLVLPITWIEAQFGKSPDGGDGSLERMLGLVPLLAGLILGLRLLVRARREGAQAQPEPGR